MTVAAYRDRTTGRYPITLAEIRANSSMLFGSEEPPEPWVMDEANVDPVYSADPPAYDTATHTLAEGAPAQSGGEWRQTWTLTALPPPPEPILLTYKADVWRRSTEAQAATIDTELQKLDVRRRRLWDDAAYLDHSDELVTFFRQMLAQTFGESEANRILAPSNV